MTPSMSSTYYYLLMKMFYFMKCLSSLPGLLPPSVPVHFYSLKNLLYRGGIDKKFDAVGKKFDAMKAELKSDIKDTNNKFTEHKKEVEEEGRKVLERVAFSEGEIAVIKSGIFYLIGNKGLVKERANH